MSLNTPTTPSYADLVKRFAAREKIAAERKRQAMKTAAERKRQESERKRQESERKRQEYDELFERLKRQRLRARACGHACRYFDAHPDERQEQKINAAVDNMMTEIARLEHGPRRYIDNFMDVLENVSDDDRRQMVVDIISDYAEVGYPESLKKRKEFDEMWSGMDEYERHFHRWRNHLWG